MTMLMRILMNRTNQGKGCSLFSSSRKTETSCWQAGYPDGPSSRAEIISGTSTTVTVGISDYPWSSGRIVVLCIKVRDLQHRRQASPERSPLRPRKKRKKNLQMAVLNHTLPQCSCFTESCKFNEGEQRWQILPGYPHPKNAVKTQKKVATWPGASRRLKWRTSLTVQMQQKGFSITNFLLDLGSSPFFLHCNSYWSASQAPASRHKLVTPGAKRRRHGEKGGGRRPQVQARAKKRLVPSSENLRFYRIQHSSNWDTTKKKLPMQKLPDTSWHSYNDRFKSDDSVGRPDRHTTQKTPFPWILSFVPSFPLRSCNNNNDSTAYMWILLPSFFLFFPSPVFFFFFFKANFRNLARRKNRRRVRKVHRDFFLGKSGTTSPHYEGKKILKSPYLENEFQQVTILYSLHLPGWRNLANK